MAQSSKKSLKFKDLYKNFLKGDNWVWVCILLLFIISCIAVYSSIGLMAISVTHTTPFHAFSKHVVFLLIAVASIILIAEANYRIIYKAAPFLFLFGLGALLFMATVGGGRWITFGSTSLQPSEFAKMFLILYLSRLLSRYQQMEDEDTRKKFFYIMLGLVAVTAACILPENFSTAALVTVVCLFLFFLSGIQRKLVICICLCGALLAGLFLSYAHHSYVKQRDLDPQIAMMMGEQEGVLHRLTTWGHRVDSWLNPNPEELTQESMARMAVASGGFKGAGIGNTIQARLMTQAHNDFIYAIIIEEMGWGGALVVFAVYAILFLRCLVISYHCQGLYGSYVTIGLGSLIFLQALVNMFVAVGVLPVTGQTLPMVSSGGSSLLSAGIALGIIQSVANDNNKRQAEVKRAEKERQQFQQTVDIANTQNNSSKK